MCLFVHMSRLNTKKIFEIKILAILVPVCFSDSHTQTTPLMSDWCFCLTLVHSHFQTPLLTIDLKPDISQSWFDFHSFWTLLKFNNILFSKNILLKSVQNNFFGENNTFLIDNILTTHRPRVEIKVSGWRGGWRPPTRGHGPLRGGHRAPMRAPCPPQVLERRACSALTF